MLNGRAGTPVWSTRTDGNPGSRLVLQSDGNLVVYSPANRPLFANRIQAGGGTRVVAQADGNLVEYSATGKAVWATGTAGR